MFPCEYFFKKMFAVGGESQTEIYGYNTKSLTFLKKLGKFTNWFTLSKVQKIRVILRISENTFHLLQRLSMGKQFLKFKKIKKTFVPKIILHNYILYKGDPTYVAIFPVDSGMHQIFTDFQHSTWW